MKLEESLKFAGQVNINFVEITTSTGFVQNVTNQVAGISVYEDLFSPFISGKIVFRDSQDLTNLFPFVGEEQVNLSISTPTIDDVNKIIRGRFTIYKMSEREMLADRSLVYVLHFISQEALIDLNRKLARSYEGKVSDVARTLISTGEGLNTKKKVNIEDTTQRVKFIANYWSPAKTLNYLTSEGININGSPSYLFFENRTGFNFLSLDKLYSEDVVQNFVFDNYTNTELRGNPQQDYKRVLDISIPTAYNYMEKLGNGMYSSKLISYDVLTKKFTSKNFSYLDNFDKQKHLNPFPVTSKVAPFTESSLVFTEGRHYGNFNGYYQSRTKQMRLSLLGQAEYHKVSITVPGRTDYTVGQKISLKLYKTNHITAEKADDDIDKVYSGNYLISAIHHDITRDNHTCYMEIIKDSLIIDMNRGGR